MTFNPDEFIAGIQTAETTVTVFKRADLAGKLLAVEADIGMFPENEQKEVSLSDGGELAELIAQRDEYREQLKESAVDFTIRAVDDDERDRLAKEARKAAAEQADAAAKDAAAVAREECRRSEIGDKNEMREAVRRATSSASNAVVQREIGYYIMAAAIVGEDGAPMFTPEQMRTVAEKLGARQVQNIQDAFYDLTSVDPASFVPKSQQPGPTEED